MGMKSGLCRGERLGSAIYQCIAIHAPPKSRVCSCVKLPNSGANAFAPSAPTLLPAWRSPSRSHNRNNTSRHATQVRIQQLGAPEGRERRAAAPAHGVHSRCMSSACSCLSLPSDGAKAAAPLAPKLLTACASTRTVTTQRESRPSSHRCSQGPAVPST